MIKLTIMLTQDGNVSVEGPLQDKILCYGLLEMAKDTIKNFVPSPIITPTLNGPA